MKWIDVAKGMAIISVVIGHVVSSYQSSGLYMSSHLFQFSHHFVYSFHMALFMLVSGLLFSYAPKRKPDGVILQKIINYGIPYVTFSFVWWIMKCILASHTNTPVSIEDILLIPLYPISFMWYIYALLLMQILQVIIGERGRGFQILHVSAALLLMLAAPLLSERFAAIDFEDLVICDVIKFYVYFLVGVYFGKDLVDWLEKSNMAGVACVSGICLVAANVLTYAAPDLGNSVVKCIVALDGCVFLIAAAHLMDKNRVLNALGRRSLAIYVLHGLAIAGTRSLLVRFWRWSDCGGLVPWVICTIAGVILPLAAYELSTRIWRLDFFFTPGKYIRIKK